MDAYIVLLAGLGGLVLVTAWLPMLLKELPLSLPIFCVALGAGVFALPGMQGAAPHPQEALGLTERLTELVVIVALTGCGLKLDRPLGWARCGLLWRLILIAMPLTIAALAGLSSLLLGLGLATAILLAAALAPTDPVLASDVQVGPPGEGQEDDIRFTLTAEAGLNDGLSFPFVNLAIALAVASAIGKPWLIDWLTIDVAWKIFAGLAVGLAVGIALGWLAFRLPNRAKLARTGDGFVALGITLVSYALTEMAHGYGFVAVFVSALAFRSIERDHRYHHSLHEFIEQMERLMMMVLLFLFGAAITGANLLGAVDWAVAAFALLTLFLVRPATAWISLLGRSEPAVERAVIAFFGIRGIGSAYYLAYGLGHADFEQEPRLWSAVALTVLISIVLHGMTVTPVMRWLDRRASDRDVSC